MTPAKALKLIESVGQTDTDGQVFEASHQQTNSIHDEIRFSTHEYSVLAFKTGTKIVKEELIGALEQHANLLRRVAADIDRNLKIEPRDYPESLEVGEVITRGDTAWSVQQVDHGTGKVILRRLG